jgi:metallophosphoesterase (TIGR00282 family)
MIKILFIGDIVGKIGRETVKKILPGLKKEFKPDLIIANGENLAHGKGVTKSALEEMIAAGINWFTNGDHAFSREKQIEEIYSGELPILRPANYSIGALGKGYAIIESGKHKILLINLIGRVFMKMDYDCPFRKLDEILANPDLAKKSLSAIIVDMHAEATSEKIALKHYADGRVSAVLGTHTHIMTADSEITNKGVAYISDVGMTGFADGVIGVDKENIIKSFLTQIKYTHEFPEAGKTVLSAVLITINSRTAKAIEIKPITSFVKI